MAELPSGTVSLLFSDIEGSTTLLSRLGPAYAAALDAHRRVLRAAWAEHGGTELGTEGDSFYVVFRTAGQAVAAATQAQREIAARDWPADERVRVRIGIHTGSPGVHDGAYVGMDVHRAARIAGAAHGGQVVLSQTTAHLAEDHLPQMVGLRDLGSHRLKDIPRAERLFQLTIDGLQNAFPPLRTLGTSSSLPRPATPLVGRERELAGLAALLHRREVRLLTLTGPGGAGKTRLAVALAQAVLERFPDGVFFVPLAAVTTSELMWTSVGELLDAPPERRMPPALFEHVAHRSALVVLDNLEQIDDAHAVVAALLEAAPGLVMVTTSRRPLHVAGEHEHPVPPLELPIDAEPAAAVRSEAVQLFVQHATMVRPSFELTADNTADVVAVCRRLDGLPLAIELAAARLKLLSPAALLSRLDQALDLAATGHHTPTRQRTLRATLAWSYDLLDSDQQAFFRRLGVFSGGADLAAVAAVTVDLPPDRDPLDLLGDIVDASLAVVSESPVGEPRVTLLGTTRDYALQLLQEAGETQRARQLHGEHYGELPGVLRSMLVGPHYVAAVDRFALELANLREALAWALERSDEATAEEQVRGRGELSLAADLASLAISVGYVAEARSWLERAIEAGQPGQEKAVAACKARLAEVLLHQGEHERVRDLARQSLDVSRSAGDHQTIVTSLSVLATSHLQTGDNVAARQMLQEAAATARAAGLDVALSGALGALFTLEADEGNLERAQALLTQTSALDERLGVAWGPAWAGAATARLLLAQGKYPEAAAQVPGVVRDVLTLGEPGALAAVADLCVAILGHGDPEYAAQLLGAVDAMRQREGRPRPRSEDDNLQRQLATIKRGASPENWARHYDRGSAMTVEALLLHVSETAQASPSSTADGATLS